LIIARANLHAASTRANIDDTARFRVNEWQEGVAHALGSEDVYVEHRFGIGAVRQSCFRDTNAHERWSARINAVDMALAVMLAERRNLSILRDHVSTDKQ